MKVMNAEMMLRASKINQAAAGVTLANTSTSDRTRSGRGDLDMQVSRRDTVAEEV